MTVYADDGIMKAAVLTALEHDANIELVPAVATSRARVSLIVAHQIDDPVLRLLRRLRRSRTQVGLVLDIVGAVTLPYLLAHGVLALVRRTEANQEQLTHMVAAIARSEPISDFQPPPCVPPATPSHKPMPPYPSQCLAPLNPREIRLLQLAADGLNTEEIAQKMAYSSRTVKNVLKGVTGRFHLHNRTHAVAWALRQGFI
ncbi:response regulator transcription factor [Saccharopolyspora sp. 5N708]|uniref:response regulator transcription factor n=1 Tax=Saccharopolyspora sp. 5N708 TaxID=3457424 RepID=UPI003FD65FDD